MKKIFTLSFICFSIYSITAQQNCNTAVTVGPGITAASYAQGSQVPLPDCITFGGSNASRGAWYKYTPTQLHTTTVTTEIGQLTSDTRLHIYTGSCGNLTCYASDDDSGANNASTVTFTAQPNVTYYIAFDNKWTSENFSFNLIEGPFTPPLFTSQQVAISAMAVTDMNGDYLDDIIQPGGSSVGILYQAENDSGFTQATLTSPFTQNTASWSIAAGDYDSNGYNDLLYGGGSGATILLANNTGTAFSTKLETPQYVFSQRTNFVDINNDGNLDAFVCHDVEPNVYFLNDGNGGFTFFQGGLGDHPSGGNYGSIWVDYDNDGDSDLFIAKCRGGGNDPAAIDELHRNDGNGEFTTVASANVDLAGMADMQQSWSSAWADYDNDGDMDAFVGASSDVSGGHRLKRNNGDGTFTDIVAGSGFDTFIYLNIENVAHDFDNDGFVDVFGGGNKIMHNNGDMTFTPLQIQAGNGPIGDLNNDGFLDIVNNNTIFFNYGNDNNWLKVLLQGTDSNRNGIGARIEVYTATEGVEKQIRDVRSGDGFRYMSSLNTHFGLGAAESIEKVVVKWPSGTVDTLLNPNMNEPLMVVEGEHVLENISFNSNAFVLFPNPAQDVINISGDNKSEMVTSHIYDLGGRLIKSQAINNATIPVQSLSKGTYILVLTDTKGEQHTSKFIKG